MTDQSLIYFTGLLIIHQGYPVKNVNEFGLSVKNVNEFGLSIIQKIFSKTLFTFLGDTRYTCMSQCNPIKLDYSAPYLAS